MKHIKTETQYRGLAKNLATNQYDELFSTYITEYLCHCRTIEAAEIKNKYSETGTVYNTKDIIIQSRTVESYATEWK